MTGAEHVVSRDELLRRAAGWRGEGKTLALANGLFDLIHVGHLRYLEEAATLADVLVVAINDMPPLAPSRALTAPSSLSASAPSSSRGSAASPS